MANASNKFVLTGIVTDKSPIDAKVTEKEALLASGQVQDKDFYTDYQALKDRLDAAMDEWESATIAVDEFQNE